MSCVWFAFCLIVDKWDQMAYKYPEDEADLDDFDPMTEDAESGRNNYKVNVDDLDFAIYGHNFKERNVCKYYLRGDCWKGEGCFFEHVDPEKRFDLDEKEEEIINTGEPFVLKTGSSVIIKITNIKTPSNFYGILPYGPVSSESFDILELNKELEAEKAPEIVKYNEMCQRLCYHYSKMSAQENSEVFHAIGSLVAVRYENSFFRGRVLDNDFTNNSTTVLDIDMQNIVKVNRSDTFKLQFHFSQTPAMAYNFGLANVVPVQSRWDDDSIRKFSMWCLGNYFFGQIVFRDGADKYLVELLGFVDGQQEMISDMLIKNSFAISVEDKTALKENGIISADLAADSSESDDDFEESDVCTNLDNNSNEHDLIQL